MMRLALDVIAATFAGSVALADEPAPEFRAADVVGHVVYSDTRELCFGTVEACAGRDPAVPETIAAAPGFDLLINFALGSHELSPQARANLREFAVALADPALAGRRFSIEGHTDARGSESFNQALSERRVASVIGFLGTLGVEAARLEPRGFGETALRDPDDPNAGINRRVEAALIE